MKLERSCSLLIALFLASCSSTSTSPSATPANEPRVGAAVEGQAGADTISTTRMRLRRVGAGDIQTSLTTGQEISVPINVNLDVWAEIVRLETDRARLMVDWGNGTVDHTGCGSCRLENIYKKEGRYTLTAKVLDLNASGGAADVALATVTIIVEAPPAPSATPSGTPVVQEQTFCRSRNVMYGAPDAGSVIPIATVGTIEQVTAQLTSVGTILAAGELRARVGSPAGTFLNLVEGPMVDSLGTLCGNGTLNLTLRDDAPVFPVPQQVCVPGDGSISGTYRARAYGTTDTFAIFTGQSVTGNWILNLGDPNDDLIDVGQVEICVTVRYK